MIEVLKGVAVMLLMMALGIFVVESCQRRMDRAVDKTADAIVEIVVKCYEEVLTESIEKAFKEANEESEERWRQWREEMDAKYGKKPALADGGAK